VSFFTIALPPGVYANGTVYSGKGRFCDANLWRWYSGEQRPVGGWMPRTETHVTGAARAILAWKSNTNTPWAGIGTHTGLFSLSKSGIVADITPVGYQVGRADAKLGGGYGSGPYGRGVYGRARPSTTNVIEATVWSLDTWGQDLVGCTPSDQKLYEWVPGSSSPAAPIANAPQARALVVTSDRILMALGAGNPRRVKWCDQENNTDWVSTAINYAGEFDLQTAGRLLCGRRITGGTLLFTDVDVWLATFVGQPFVYSFTRAGSGGAISAQAVAVTDSLAVWMSQNERLRRLSRLRCPRQGVLRHQPGAGLQDLRRAHLGVRRGLVVLPFGRQRRDRPLRGLELSRKPLERRRAAPDLRHRPRRLPVSHDGRGRRRDLGPRARP
jgi:hypothetical protein